MNQLSKRVLWASIMVAAVFSTASAEEPARPGRLSLMLENDLFYRVDQHYTSGIGFSWVPGADVIAPERLAGLTRLVPWFPDQGEIRHGYAFGQSIFTPSDISVADPPLSERPYAGWLYGTIGIGVESGGQLDQLGLTFGLVGPASLAEQGQKLLHKISPAKEPRGWDSQLRNEPGFFVAYQRSRRRLVAENRWGAQLDFTSHMGGALGNVYTYAHAGGTLRYGRQLPNNYESPRIQPGLPDLGEFSPSSGFGWYLFAGVEGRAIARNIFLDGNSFRDSRSVDKHPFVGDLQFGFVVVWADIRLSYTHVLRTREFQSQNKPDNFGSVSVSVKLK